MICTPVGDIACDDGHGVCDPGSGDLGHADLSRLTNASNMELLSRLCPQNSPFFSKKARSAFLFYKFYKFSKLYFSKNR